MKSKHYELKKLYYSNLAKNPDSKEWENWEYSHSGYLFNWKRIYKGHPAFNEDFEYRYNPLPKTIIVNGIEVPEPCREMPENGTRFYYPDIGVQEYSYLEEFDNNNIHHRRIFELGFAHLVDENAIKHAKALFGIQN